MTYHPPIPNMNEVFAIQQVFQHVPTQVKMHLGSRDIIVEAPNKLVGTLYVNMLSKAGWAAVSIKNHFVDQYLVLCVLHQQARP